MKETNLPEKEYFEPSTIENIDKSVLEYIKKLNLHAQTNEGFKPVPIMWGTSERSYVSKGEGSIRDSQGMLKLPIMSIKRTGFTKPAASKGIFQGNVPEHGDHKGGSLVVSRVINQEKTNNFAKADSKRITGQDNYKRKNKKIVYKTISTPMPVNVELTYELKIRTEYQQQMNDLILPFVTMPGTINYIRLFEGEHRYEGFIQGEFQNGDNLANFSSEERKFETKITLKVIGYLVGQEDNRDKPHYSVRENAVEVKIPRERISLNEIPEHEFGAYYGLAGIKDPVILSGFPAPFIFSNVPAVGGGSTAASSASESAVSSNIVTDGNFSKVLADNLVVREILKSDTDGVPSPANQITITGATVRANTESLYVNGVLQSVGGDNDYTISGNVITLTYNLDADDAVFVTYIKQ